MAYDPEKDKEVDRWESDELVVSVNSYNGGPPKLRFIRMVHGKFLRAGPLSQGEVKFLGECMDEIQQTMEGASNEKPKEKKTKRSRGDGHKNR